MKKSIFGAAAAIAILGGVASAQGVTMSGDGGEQKFGSIQSALDAIKDGGQYTITLAPGTYKEVLYYNGPATIRISGDTKARRGADVVISEANDGDLYKQKRAKSQQNGRCIFEFEGTGNLILENLTMENTYSRKTGKGSNTQAETVGFDSSGTLAAYNCTFKSHQDTLRTTGKSWFYDCYVEGDTDFIWMETRGKVALFENCDIKSLYDEKSECIIGAPRMEYGPKSGKGLVFLNCAVACGNEGEEGTTYLARTPWNSGYYNQVAYINTRIPQIDAKLWKGDPLMANGVARTVLGWKLDSATLATAKDADGKPISAKGRNDILSSKEVKAEFSGRRSILNRLFDHARNAYRKDYETYWNVDTLISNSGWSVSEDKSKEIGSGEKEAKFSVYDFSKDISTYGDLTVSGFQNGTSAAGETPYIIGSEGAEISFRVTEKSVVTVCGLFEGRVTISADKQGDGVVSFANGSKVNVIQESYIVAQKNSTVKIKADSTTRISKIVVETDPKIKFVPVKSVKVSPKEEIGALKARKKAQFQVSWEPVMASNRNFDWSVSDESKASVNEFGLVKAMDVPEDCTVKVIATAKDSKRAVGSYELKILKANPNEFELTWLGSIDDSAAPFPGISDNSAVMAAENASPSSPSWKLNDAKFNSSFSDGGISFEGYSEAISNSSTAYVDFPMVAKRDLDIKSIVVSYGNHGTSNVGALFTVIRASGAEEILDDTSRTCRSAKKVYDDEGLLDTIPVKAGERIVLRIALYGVNGNGETTIAKGKSPTLGTVVVSGLAK